MDVKRSETILDIKGLKVHFSTRGDLIKAVDGIDITIHKGSTFAIVGESGSGKSVTALSIMRLIPRLTGMITGGRILFGGLDLLKAPEREMPYIRGKEIGMIFQEPMTSLNPVMKVGEQIREVVMVHKGLDKRQATEDTVRLLRTLGIPSPEARFNEYPHQMSGGMRQRIMIAIAIICTPKLLIADEPTTALDVIVQAQILDLIKRIQIAMKMSIMFITHDLAIVAEIADRVAVMYRGKIVELTDAKRFFRDARHPYSIGLLRSVSTLRDDRGRGESAGMGHGIYNIQNNGGMCYTRDGLREGWYKRRQDKAFMNVQWTSSSAQFDTGCKFYHRCGYRVEKCKMTEPELNNIADDHRVACWIFN